MEESSDLVLDLLLLDAVVVAAVVGVYAGYLKVRSLFRGLRGLKTKRDIDRALRWLGIHAFVYKLLNRKSAWKRSQYNGSALGNARGSLCNSSFMSFWIPYFRRRGLWGVIARRGLERRVRLLLTGRSRHELEKIAFSLIYWRHRDCPDDELFIARPPHHISLRRQPPHLDQRKLEQRRLVAATLAGKPRNYLVQVILDRLRDFSSRSVQWLLDCIENGWVEQMGATRSRTIRFTRDSEKALSGVPGTGLRQRGI